MMSIKNIVRITAPLGVAFALVLVGTVPAFAAWGDSTYTVWSDISATSPMMPGQSPHGEYDTASQKCGVCHAVHGATNPASEKLLMSSAADACSYCHIVARVSDYVVYDGLVGNYTGTDYDRGHNTGYAGSTNAGCIDCHQVHAASSKMTANELLTDKILIGDKVYNEFDMNYDERAGAPLSTDTEAQALSKWCTKCHVASSYAYYFREGDINKSSHVMKDASSNYLLGSGETTTVAFSTSQECSSCHVSGFGTSSWPHYTAGARFLVSAVKDGDPMLPTASGQTDYDGVCLRCHTDGTTGVGVTW